MSEQEMGIFRSAAGRAGMPLSAWVRMVLRERVPAEAFEVKAPFSGKGIIP